MLLARQDPALAAIRAGQERGLKKAARAGFSGKLQSRNGTLKHIFQKNAIKFETRVTSNEQRDKKITFTIPYAMLCVSVYLPRYSFKIRGFQSLHPTAKS